MSNPNSVRINDTNTVRIVSTENFCILDVMVRDAKSAKAQRESYHHGNLPTVLTEEAARLLEEKGADGFSLREVARRAGVGVATPSHHFGGARGLLTAVATCGFEKLTAQQTEAMAAVSDPIARVVVLCQTYVRMGASYPGHAAVMFRWDMVDGQDKAYSKAASNALELLRSAVAEAAPAYCGSTMVDHAAKTLWATMHGFVTLSLSEGDFAMERIEFAVRTLITGMRE